MTALFDRVRTGKGQLIETSLFEGEITYLMDAGMQYLTTGESKGKWGSEHAQLVPYKAFQARDGWVVIGAGWVSGDAWVTGGCDGGDPPDCPGSVELMGGCVSVASTLAPSVRNGFDCRLGWSQPRKRSRRLDGRI